MSDENLYNLQDDVLATIEREIAHAEIDSDSAEQFLDNVFPGIPAETKAKIALFAEKYYEFFLAEDEEDDTEEGEE